MNKTFEPMEFTGERYVPELRGVIELEHLHRYLQACHFAAGKVLLDIASGEGYGSAMLAQTAARVIGVDSSVESVEHARNRYQKNNLEFTMGSCARIPLPDACVDIVVSFETIEHHDQHEQMMQEVKRVLRQDGMLLISTPDRHHYSVEPGHVNPFHVKELFQHEFKQLLGNYFKHIVYFGQRVIYGSGLFAELPMPIVSYSYGHSIAKASSGISKPTYLIAVASDVSLPVLASSVLEQPLDDSEVIQSWNQLVSERDAQITRLSQAVAERDQELTSLRQVLGERDAHVASLINVVAERDERIREATNIEQGLNLAVTERDQELTSLRQVLGERDAHVASLINVVAERDAQIASLNHVVIGRDEQLGRIMSSSSWQLTSPLRELRRWLRESWLQGKRYLRRGLSLGQRIFQSRDGPAVGSGGNETPSSNASALFDTEWYLDSYPDVRAAGVNPLEHFAASGWVEGRNPHRLFDVQWYLDTYPDVRAADVNPLEHFCAIGWLEGRNPHPQFDVPWYLDTYPDVRAAGINPLVHYVESGAAELRNPNANFDAASYVGEHPDAATNPLLHYLRHGTLQKTDPTPPTSTAER